MALACTNDSVFAVTQYSVMQLWLLRLLVPLGAHKCSVQQVGFADDGVVQALGLDVGCWGDDKGFDRPGAILQLREMYEAAEAGASYQRMAGCVGNNVMRLQKLFGLSETDCRILEFAVSIHNDPVLDDVADNIGRLSTVKLYRTLSVVLGMPEPDIRAAFSTQSILARVGLVRLDRGTLPLKSKLDLLSSKFADLISSGDAEPVSLLRGTVALAPPPVLTVEDYGHVKEFFEVLCLYLKHSMQAERTGVNVYLHGPSGTGKSQLVRVLARELGCELFEVASEDSDGDPIGGEKRLSAYRAAQGFFGRRRALIVFDEVQDVFDDGGEAYGKKSTAQTRKAWMNRMLEENRVPAVWVSNARHGLDPAFIRRFDLVFELPVPPKERRREILETACGDLLSGPASTLLAEAESLAPAVVARAAGVVRLIREDLGPERATAAFERLIKNTLEAQGHEKPEAQEGHRLPGIYDPAFIHSNTNLDEVAVGLKRAKAGRLCLYGPPGTGKSAYARWLAGQMGVPLVAKRASDLLSMYVGGNEKNISRAFAQAKEEGALLLIDEVDGFLQDRRGAHRGWEVSLVNEMLTQMETFAGVFVATTNLMEGLDPAALRRFDLKAKFDYLKSGQAVELLRRHCAECLLAPPTVGDEYRVARLPALTPGDFAAVSRQHRFRPVTSATAWVTALEAECELKTGPKRAIGFY